MCRSVGGGEEGASLIALVIYSLVKRRGNDEGWSVVMHVGVEYGSHWAGQERGTFWYLATTNPCLQRFAHAPRMRSLTRPGVQSEREGGGREWQGERKM